MFLVALPPVGRWVVVFNNALFIGRTSTEPSTVFFSDLGDPEVWTTDNDYKFDGPIMGMGVLGNLVVVFKQNSIGVLSGTNNEKLIKIDKYINGIGCSGGHSIFTAKIKGQDVLIFHSDNGLWAFDGSRNLIDLSNCIRNKYQDGTTVNKWNTSRFQYAWGTYIPKYKWGMLALSDSGDATNDFLLIIDLDRIQETRNGMYVPHWPMDAVPANCLTCSKSVTTTRDDIYFGDTTGFIYRFDPSIFNRNGTAYNGYFRSKILDNIKSWILIEANLMADEGGETVTIAAFADLDTASVSASVSLDDDADLLGTTFILGTSVLGGKDFVFKDAGLNTWGRFLQFRISNSTLNEGYRIESLNFIFQETGLEPNAKLE